MSSRFSNKFPIPEKFPEILHDYAREVVRYMPKDILDFSIQYFYSLDQNIPFNYMEGASDSLPKLGCALEQKEKSKENRDTLSTPSLATNQNTQNLFYRQSEISEKKGEKEIKEIRETNSSKNNSPIDTEENKHESNNKKKGNLTIENESEKNSARNIQNENRGEKFNKSGTTFSNISGNSSTKNGVRNFVGDVINESKKYAIENEKKII